MTPPKTFAVEHELGFCNLVVGGCSFTNNFDTEHIHAWPFYLRDLGGFADVYDTSCPGAGNSHIHRSIITCIDTNDLDADNTLVVVMWSGYDRDDFIVDPRSCDKRSPDHYAYTDHASLGFTGGLLGDSNLLVNVEPIKKIKSNASRSLENYIAIRSLSTYLQAQGFKHVFCEFSTPGQMKDNNFDPAVYLPQSLQVPFVNMVRELAPNLGDWAIPDLKNTQDGYHPDAEHHLAWTRSVLLPFIKSKL